MPNYYGSFMQKQAFKNHYVQINAPNEFEARNVMHAHFGANFMTVYDEEKFLPQIDQYGLSRLCTIEVINHGDEVRPNLEHRFKGE